MIINRFVNKSQICLSLAEKYLDLNPIDKHLENSHSISRSNKVKEFTKSVQLLQINSVAPTSGAWWKKGKICQWATCHVLQFRSFDY